MSAATFTVVHTHPAARLITARVGLRCHESVHHVDCPLVARARRDSRSMRVEVTSAAAESSARPIAVGLCCEGVLS